MTYVFKNIPSHSYELHQVILKFHNKILEHLMNIYKIDSLPELYRLHEVLFKASEYLNEIYEYMDKNYDNNMDELYKVSCEKIKEFNI